MDSLDGQAMHDAAKYVAECGQYADIHTVTVTLNGATGGTTVTIQGFAKDSTVDYLRTFEVTR